MADKALKQYLQDRWAEHKARLRIEPITTEGAKAGIGVMQDDTDRLDCFFIILLSDERMRGWRSMLDRGLARKPMDTIAEVSRKRAQALRQLDVRRTIRWFGIDGSEPSLAHESVDRFRNELDDDQAVDAVQGQLYENLKNLEVKRLEKAGLGAMRSAFSPEAMDVLTCVDAPSWTDYSFYASRQRGGVRREQASIFPMLADAFARRPHLRETIDAAAPLKPALQNGLGLSKGVQKRLQGVWHPVSGMDGSAFAYQISRLQPDWVPTTSEQWDAFMDVAASVGRYLADTLGLDVGELYKGSKGDWCKFRNNLARSMTDTRPPETLDEASFERLKSARDWKRLTKMPKEEVPDEIERMVEGLDLPENLNRQTFVDWLNRVYAPREDRERLEIAAWDAGDMPKEFADKVLVPFIANRLTHSTDAKFFIDEGTRTRAFETAVDLLFGNKSAPAIFELSLAWHNDWFNQIARFATGADAEHHETERLGDWPALTAAVQAPNGLWIVPEVTADQLADAGDHLSNCVGGRARQCREGAHIVSLRTDPEAPASRLTVCQLNGLDLTVDRPWEGIRPVEHRGYENAPPSEQERMAIEWYVDAVRSNQIAVNMDDIRAYFAGQEMQGPIGQTDRVMRDCEYDYRDTQSVERAFQSWRPYLPKTYRNMDVLEFARSVDAIQSMISGIDPDVEPTPKCA